MVLSIYYIHIVNIYIYIYIIHNLYIYNILYKKHAAYTRCTRISEACNECIRA